MKYIKLFEDFNQPEYGSNDPFTRLVSDLVNDILGQNANTPDDKWLVATAVAIDTFTVETEIEINDLLDLDRETIVKILNDMPGNDGGDITKEEFIEYMKKFIDIK